MPLDPNILLQAQPIVLPDPLNSLAKVTAIQGAQNTNSLAQMQLAKATRDQAKEQGLNDAISGAVGTDGKIDFTKASQSLASSGNGSAIPAFQKTMSDAQKAQLDVQKAQIDQSTQHLALIGQVLGGVKDQPTYTAALTQLRTALGPDAGADMPAVYDPAAVAAAQQRAMTTQQQLDQHSKDLQYQLNVNNAAETQRHNKVGETTAQGQLGVAQGNLKVSQARLASEQDGPDTGFTDDAITNAAARYNIDGTLPATGMGKAGAAARAAILNKAAVLANTSGVSPDDQRIAQLGNKANAAALSKLQQQQTMVGAFEKNFNKNADIALGLSQQTDNTGVPLANKWINAGKRAVTGDPNLSAYDASLKATVNEYAKIVSGSMGNTALAEGEIKKVNDLLNAAQTPAQVSAVLGLMKRETQNRMQGFEDEKTQLKAGMGGKKPIAPAAATPAATPAAGGAKPSLADIFGDK